MTKQKIVPFRLGDTVRHRKTGEKHVINECTMAQHEDALEYSTDIGAWYSHEEFELLQASSSKSRKLILEIDMDEEDED